MISLSTVVHCVHGRYSSASEASTLMRRQVHLGGSARQAKQNVCRAGSVDRKHDGLHRGAIHVPKAKASTPLLQCLTCGLVLVAFASQLSRIESLLGVTGVRRVIGMLGQDERKQFYLEDLTSRIYIDLSNAVRLFCTDASRSVRFIYLTPPAFFSAVNGARATRTECSR